MTESRFRERRSAHRDETESPDVEGAPETAEPAPPVAPATAAESPTIEEHEQVPETPEPFPPAMGAEADESPAESPPGAAEIAAYLDQLERMEPPEPSFLELIGPHVEEALRYLGELPLTPDGERRILPRWAKREIDLLGLVEQRTRGNLPPDEQEYLRQALDHLRTAYLKVSR
jgi:hypothetical protein